MGTTITAIITTEGVSPFVMVRVGGPPTTTCSPGKKFVGPPPARRMMAWGAPDFSADFPTE